MSLRVFNTLSGEKEDFVPLTQGQARMYVCGVTVYDSSHSALNLRYHLLPVSEISRIPGVVTIGRKPIEFAWNSRTGESYLDMSGGTEWKVQ
jgi:hypothetical protein